MIPFEEAVRRAQESQGLEILYLMVRADNVPAVSLYEKRGFETQAVLDYDTKIGNQYYSHHSMNFPKHYTKEVCSIFCV